MNRTVLKVFGALVILLCLPSALALENGWPRTLPLEQGTVTIYSLQVDEMNDGILHFRAALAYRETAGAEPVFGAGWFESRVDIDFDNRIVHPTDLKVTETRFPDGTDDVQAGLSAVLAQESANWNLDFSVDELEAALKQAETETKIAQSLNTAPPRIIYRDHPALLISLDGEPVLREIEDSPYQAVINTPYPMIFDGRNYYLNAARDVWYRADKAIGPYKYEADPPADLAAMVEADESDTAEEQAAVSITAANAPEIVVSTEPAELIVTDGPAAFVPLVDDLLVLQNSGDDVFMHVSSQNFYIVLAGRWYRSGSLDGPWAYEPADQLPPAFANIPEDSSQADSRVHVAGTPEARDAVMDAQVPQTAAVARGEVDIEVEYDGQPVYQPVDGTDLVYIQNTGSTVLQSDGLYYLVEDGVWYVSATPNGPWQVSTSRPPQVDTILPTSPVHNVKYVHVYDSTPDVVYVGYTPGYTGSYVYHNTIFYGSGWNYRPWVSPYYYYPRHSTWGWNVSYNPWSGWNFGLSWGWGPFSVGYYSGGYWHHNHYWHHRHYGRWGPGRYRPRHYGHHRSGRGDYGRRDYGRRGHGRSDNLYRDSRQRAIVADTRDIRQRPPGRRNDDSRQANLAVPGGRRDQGRTKAKKGERNRTTPIKPTDMRDKARQRDADFAVKRDLVLADGRGSAYRKTIDSRGRNVAANRSSKPGKGTRNRITPLPSGNRQNSSLKSARVISENTARGSAPVTSNRSSQPSRTRVANSQARQQRPREAGVPARSSQPRARNTRPAPRTPRVTAMPAPKQNVARPKPKPQSSQKTSHNRTAAAQRAPRASQQQGNGQRAPRASPQKGNSRRVAGAGPQKSRSQRAAPNRGGDKRAGARRPKK